MLVEYDGDDLWYDTAAYAMTGIAAQEFFAIQRTVRLSHTVRTRTELSLSIAETEVDDSAFAWGSGVFTVASMQTSTSNGVMLTLPSKAEQYSVFPSRREKESLHLPPAQHWSLLRQMGAYLMGVFDEKGNLIGWYAGSDTAKEGQGMFSRWQYGYYKVIDNARHGTQPSQSLSPSSYIRLLIKAGYTVHIRPVLMVGHAHARKAHVVAF